MHKEIGKYLAHIIPILEQRGLEITEHKEISYGLQLWLKRAEERLNLNIYYGEKKGLSTVVGGKKSSALKAELENLLLGESTIEPELGMHAFATWIGSDECGKGDYFGPLIVSAFKADKGQLDKLKEIGVRDSKLINDSQIATIAKKLYLSFPNQMYSIILKPSRYNELMEEFKLMGKNLNDLLAWAHAKAIKELLKSDENIEGVLIDQFSRSQKVKARLSGDHPELSIIERTGAERDLAVAAASIVSRYQFIEYKATMHKKYNMNFPNGATSPVKKAARQFIESYGFQSLNEVAKLHFKTTDSFRR